MILILHKFVGTNGMNGFAWVPLSVACSMKSVNRIPMSMLCVKGGPSKTLQLCIAVDRYSGPGEKCAGAIAVQIAHYDICA